MNSGAATALPTVCSKQTSILHHTCSVYVFLLSVAVDPLYKQDGSVIVPLLLLTVTLSVQFINTGFIEVITNICVHEIYIIYL
jgi:hypothetical protein